MAVAAKGAAWNTLAMFVRQVGRLGFAVLLARWLGPADFAVVSEATIYISVTALLLETGLASRIVQAAVLRKEDIGSGQWLSMAVGFTMSALTLVTASWIAELMHTPELAAVLRWLAIGPTVKAFGVVPVAYLNRNLRFRLLSLTEMAGIVVGAVGGLTAAALGAGYWALVFQQISTDVLVVVAWVVAAGFQSWRADWAGVRGTLSFGGRILVAQGIGFLSRNVDTVIIASVLGPVPVSLYSVAYRLMTVPVQMLGNVINRVGFPVFARLQEDHAEVRRVFLRSSQLVAIGAIPSMTALAVLAPEATYVVFGPAWLGAAATMRVLALTGIVQSLVTVGGSLFLAAGRGDLALRWSVIPLVVCTIAFVVGLPWGILGVATAYAIATVLLAPMQLAAAGGPFELRLRSWFGAMRPCLLAGLAAGAAGAVVRWALLASGLTALSVLVLGGLVVVGGFFGLLALTRPDLLGAVRTALRMALRGRAGAAATAGAQS